MSYEKIKQSNEAGFLDSTLLMDENYLPRLLTNKYEKDDSTKKVILDAILEQLDKCTEFMFSVAFITNSGVACLYDTLKRLEEKGVKGKILTSDYLTFTQPRALERLLRFKNIELKMIQLENFHAKGYMFKNNDAGMEEYSIIIGSSNLTQNALKSNNEWNVKLSSTTDGSFCKGVLSEFEEVFTRSMVIDWALLHAYEDRYNQYKKQRIELQEAMSFDEGKALVPNKMQEDALQSLEALRKKGESKGILISATGTGKTYLSAFDVKRVQPKTFLFIVHRDVILSEALKSYKRVLGTKEKMALFNGRVKGDAPYLFASVQTLTKDENLHLFAPDAFDYIVVDEVHRSGAESYQKVLRYFKPKFLLGMTATPERSDGADIFEMFDHNIAYEIRLHQALEENMLVPFHYHGIQDITVDNKVLEDNADFRFLTPNERVRHFMEKAEEYGCDSGRVKGLVFCSRKEEAKELAKKVQDQYGKRTIALFAESSTAERQDAINRLQSDDPNEEQLDYIFTVDIFNEGVDIPKVNQIILLRPTESAIVFVQQLGRGLRKAAEKEYLEIIDFIGNYNNNYLIPIALYGDRTANKDKIRRAIINNSIPGASTVEFDEVVKQRIFEKLDRVNLNSFNLLKNDYKALKYQLGRSPMMMDFKNLASRDPYTFLNFSNKSGRRSYYEVVCKIENAELTNELVLSPKELDVLAFISKAVVDGRRIEEVVMLQELLEADTTNYTTISERVFMEFGIKTTLKVVSDVASYLQERSEFNSFTNIGLVEKDEQIYKCTKEFKQMLTNRTFVKYLRDSLCYAYQTFKDNFSLKNYREGFILRQTYTRRDVCRILGWKKDESSTMYGYRIKYNTCPIFVTYSKEEDISASTKYEDEFLSETQFKWYTRSRVSLDSKEVQSILKDNLRISLFVKQRQAMGTDFLYMGDVSLNSKSNAVEQETILDDKGKEIPVVKMIFDLKDKVEDKVLKYFKADFSGQ